MSCPLGVDWWTWLTSLGTALIIGCMAGVVTTLFAKRRERLREAARERADIAPSWESFSRHVRFRLLSPNGVLMQAGCHELGLAARYGLGGIGPAGPDPDAWMTVETLHTPAGLCLLQFQAYRKDDFVPGEKKDDGKAPNTGSNTVAKRDDKMTTTEKSGDPNRPHVDR